MFQINYRIVYNDWDDFPGQNGFFQIQCNDCKYGEIYAEEIESFISKADLNWWFERLTQVARHLLTKEQVALHDMESYDLWIEFRRNKDDLSIDLIKAMPPNGTRGIEFELDGIEHGEWGNQHVSFLQFKGEVIEKTTLYLNEIRKDCTDAVLMKKLETTIAELDAD